MVKKKIYSLSKFCRCRKYIQAKLIDNSSQNDKVEGMSSEEETLKK